MGNTLDAVLQAIDFIEDNLQNEIYVQDVANRACYSIYHFIRLFEGITGHTPKDYILRRRISEACSELMNSDKKIIDLCFDYQFKSPEVFSRAFKRITGATPRELQQRDFFPELSMLSKIDKESIFYSGNIREAAVEEVRLDTLHLAGLVTLVRKDKQIISQLWEFIAKDLGSLDIDSINEFYGHSFWSNNYDLDGFFLLCGINTRDFDNLEIPFCTRTVPAAKYLRFTHHGDINKISHTYKYIFQSYLPRTDYTLSLPYDFEIYHSGGKNINDESNITEILIPVDS